MARSTKNKRALPRWLRLLLFLLPLAFLLLALLAGSAWTILQTQPAQAIPAVEKIATYILGRELSIGQLHKVKLGKDTLVRASKVSLANPDWSDTRQMVHAESLHLVIRLPSLWQKGSVLIRELSLSGVALDLQDPQNNSPNWELDFIWDDEDEQEEKEKEGPFLPLIIEQGSVEQARIRYRDEDQDEWVRLESWTLSPRPDDNFTDLAMAGDVNGIPLSSQGYIGPTDALQTLEDIELQLQLKMGKLNVFAKGGFENLLTLSGADLALEIHGPRSRPLLDLLGLDEVRDGPLEFQGYLKDATPGVKLLAKGTLADFGLNVEGVVSNPREADGIDLDFTLNGPSMAEAGEIFGVSGFKDVPYELSGNIERRGTLLRVRDGFLSAAQGSLSLVGELPYFPGIDDWQATLQGRDIDLSILGAVLGNPDMPTLLINVEGKLASDDHGLELVDMQMTSAGLELVLNGIIGELPDLANTSLDASLTGADMSNLEPLLGVNPLPRRPFTMAGKLSTYDDGWRADNVRLDSPNGRINLAGDVDRLLNPQRIRSTVAVETHDLRTGLAEYGVELDLPMDLPLRLEGDVKKVQEGFNLERLTGFVGNMAFTGGGLVTQQKGFADSRVQLQASGTSLRDALQEWVEQPLPEEAFNLAMDSTYHAPLISVDHLSASLGNHHASANLKLGEGSDTKAHLHGQANLRGENLRNLLSLAGLEFDVDRGHYQLVTNIEASPGHLELDDLLYTSTHSDISGVIEVNFEDVPRIDVNLQSKVIYLSELLPDREDLEAEQRRQEAIEGAYDKNELFVPPSGKDLKERLIPDTPLSLSWLNELNGHWRLDVERVYLREDIYAQLAADMTLDGGVLTFKKLAWDGPASNGQIDLSLDATQNNAFEFKIESSRLPIFWLALGEARPDHKSRYRARLSGSGETVHEVTSGLNGIMLFEGSNVRMDNRGLDLILGDVVGSVLDRVNPFNETQKHTMMECAAGALSINDGLVQIIPGMVMRTDKVDVVSNGAASLKDEGLNINFNTRARRGLGISAGKMLTPYLKVSGTMAHPYLTLDPQTVIVSGSLAVATVGLSLVAESLWDRWVATAKNPCTVLFEQARKDSQRDYGPLMWDTAL
jgi:hypothetical protein